MISTPATQATTYTVINSGFTFSPASLTISVGDTVVFSLAGSHNTVEVSQATWNANGNTPLSGGFSTPFGGGTVIFSTAGSHYYVCSPHASGGMKGVINVVLTTLTTGSIATTTYCAGDAITVPFTATGGFTAGNVFTAQLSDGSGSFGSPTNIGSVSGTTSGQISAVIPTSAVSGTGYRVRVVSSQPVIAGSDNGTDLTVFVVPNASITPAGPTSFCDGSDVTLNASPTGAGLSYIWRRDGNVIPGANTASHVASLAGQYTVEVSNGSCSKTSSPRPVVVFDADPTVLTWTAAVDTDWSTVGNWNSQCAVPTAGDTVIINGGVQPPTGIPAISLKRLVLNNTSGIVLSNDLEVTGTLVLTSGVISLGNANLTIAATASFIATNGSGELRQAGLGSGGRSASVLFPVGANTFSYTPVTIMNAGTLDEFRVAVKEDVLSGGSTGSALGTNVVDRTWLVSEASVGGSIADVTFMWSGSEELPAFDRSGCYIARHDGADWVPQQSIGTASGGPLFMRSATGVSAFSPFAIGDGSSPLPVEYRTFTAEAVDGQVALQWETTREINSAGFEIQRSRSISGSWSGIHFIASTHRDRGDVYRYKDFPPAAGTWYYRLRQVDLDGTESYTSALRLSDGGRASLRISAADAGRVQLSLLNLLGQRVAMIYDDAVAEYSDTDISVDVSALPPGVYMYRLEQGAQVLHRRLVILR
jgi:plastocyanin